MNQQAAIDETQIGRRIKAFRTDKGITLEQLAGMTGFSKGYLSKVEKSDKAPPVSTLCTIGGALNVTVSTLLGETAHRVSLCLVRKEERPLFVTRAGTAFGYSYEAMAYKYPDRTMEPYVLTLPVAPKKKTLYRHEGEEILFVIEGTMKFQHGGERYVVKEGDCLYFDASVPHFGESAGPEAAKCFMVISNVSTAVPCYPEDKAP
ncbi:MAG: helix-turn-helix domain-containing protein [Syntrophobacteraceae bacterium]